MAWMGSPCPTRTPRVRLRLKGPKQVPKVSPTPLSPMRVEGRAPMYSARRWTSLQPLVTTAAAAFMPRPRPSHMPAAMAITFLTAPPTCGVAVGVGVGRSRERMWSHHRPHEPL